MLEYEIKGSLDNLEKKLDNLAPVLESFGYWWLNVETPRMFNTQSDPRGTSWTPLTEAYLRWKSEKGYDTRIGRQTGETFRSRSYKVTGSQLTLSFGTEHAEHYDQKRPLFPRDRLPDAWVRAIETRIQQLLDDAENP